MTKQLSSSYRVILCAAIVLFIYPYAALAQDRPAMVT